MSKQQWSMPEWMEPYIKFIRNTGGNPIEDLMNGDVSPFVNLPLFTIQTSVKSQVALLEALWGHLYLKTKAKGG